MDTRFVIGTWVFVLSFGVMLSMVWAAESEHGRAYYLRYCGSCHGVEGNGDGVVSRSLKVKPTDLTQLQKRHQGTFPLEKVMASIDGKLRIDAHGDSKMPVWGEIFEKQAVVRKDRANGSARMVRAIAEYIATIQR